MNPSHRPPLPGFVHADTTNQAQPIYTIRVHVICCADDNGGNSFADPSTVSQWIGHGLDETNAIYAAHGAGIRFSFRSGDVELLKSTRKMELGAGSYWSLIVIHLGPDARRVDRRSAPFFRQASDALHGISMEKAASYLSKHQGVDVCPKENQRI